MPVAKVLAVTRLSGAHTGEASVQESAESDFVAETNVSREGTSP